MTAPVPSDYPDVLSSLKAEIRGARTRAALAINAELVSLYWRMGREIARREDQEGWGARIVDRLSADLKAEFADMKGLSPRNLRYMRDLATAWPDEAILQRVVARLPWGHNIDLLDKVKDADARMFYALKAIEAGWTRKVLQAQIASRLHDRMGKALTNFRARLPEAEADAAQLITRDPYTFDFVELAADARERDLERALLADLQRFMLELGSGFAFVSNQYHVEVGGEDFYIDLLFFHIPTSRYVVIDLKLDKFRPRDAGQINFYVNVVDARLRLDGHAPTIGLILCATRSETVVRYALSGIDRPVAVAAWEVADQTRELVDHVPEEMQLPAVEVLQEGLERIVQAHADATDSAARDERERRES